MNRPDPPRSPAPHRSRWQVALAVLVGIVLSFGLGIGDAAAAEKRMALVIGNARYPVLPLNNPENDARVIAATLRQLGFQVTEHVNLGVKDFRKVVRDYAKRLQNEEGVGVFFYAGHGVQIDGRNYLLPVDINLRDEDEVKDEGVDIDELFVSRLERARANVRIVILDACRDNPFGNKTRNTRGAGGLAEMAARGTLIGYSAAPGATAEDGPPGTNSVYTRHLVKEMLVEGLEVELMFKSVRVKVLRDTQQRQVPWVNTSLTANFSFNPKRGPADDDVSRREDIAKLQARLEQRERDQKKIEEDLLRRLKKLEEAEAETARGRPAITAKEPAASAPAAAAAPTPPAQATPAAPAVAKIEPAPATKAKPPAAEPRVEPPPAAPAAREPTKLAKPDAAPKLDPVPKADVVAKPEAPAKTEGPAKPEAPAKTEVLAKPEAAPKSDASAAIKPGAAAKSDVAAKPAPAAPVAAAKPPPKEKAKPEPRDARLAATATPSPEKPGKSAASERCVALLIRAQLGEPIGAAETAYLQKECR